MAVTFSPIPLTAAANSDSRRPVMKTCAPSFTNWRPEAAVAAGKAAWMLSASSRIRDDQSFVLGSSHWLQRGLVSGKNKRAARAKAILTHSALVGAITWHAPYRMRRFRSILKTVAEMLKDSAS